jgi:hypothetical protein
VTISAATKFKAPDNFVATLVSATRIDLSWIDRSNRESGYTVQRFDSSTNSWTTVSGTVVGSNSMIVSGTFLPNETQEFRVRATGNTGSPLSLSTVSDYVYAIRSNSAPVLDASGEMILPTVTEDQLDNNGASVSSIIASAGGNRVTDSDYGAIEGIAIVATFGETESGIGYEAGIWEYSTSGGTRWSSIGAVSEDSALLLRDTDLIRYRPNGIRGGVASIDFRAWDQTFGVVGSRVSTAINGGTSPFSTDFETATITISAVNDAPSGNDKTISASDSHDYIFAESDFGFTDAEDHDFLELILTTLPPTSDGVLKLNGAPVTAAGSSILAEDIASLSFSPASGVTGNGKGLFTFQVRDAGGVPGVDTDQTPNTIDFNITNPPSITPLLDLTILEDSTTSAINFTVDDLDTPAADLVVSAESSNAVLLPNSAIVFSGTGSNRSFVATPVANEFGTSVINITVTDGQNSTSRSFTLTVSPVNDAPVLDNSGNMVLSLITKDDTTNPGISVASMIASAGGDRVSDVDIGALEGIAITGTSDFSTAGTGFSQGAWEYSIDSGANWNLIDVVSDSSALLLRPSDWVRYRPNGVQGGVATIDFRAWDQTSGSFGTKVSTTTSGGASAFSVELETASVMVAENLDPPMGITAVADTPNQVVVSWQWPTASHAVVQVEARKSGESFQLVGSPMRMATTATISGLQAATNYEFRVRVLTSAGLGAASTSVTATTFDAPPPVPFSLVASEQPGSINLSWSNPGNAATFVLQQQSESDTTWTTVSTNLTGTSFNVGNLEAGGALYTFRLAAVNSQGFASEFSQPIVGRTANNAPNLVSPPSNVNVSSGTTATLSAFAVDDGNPADLIYSWSILSGPGDGYAGFTDNETSLGGSTTVTFDAAGSYSIQLTVEDARGLKTQSTISANVTAVLSEFKIDQDDIVVRRDKSRNFTVSARDQFGNDFDQSGLTWSLTSGDGTLNSDGRYTPPDPFEEGSITIQAELEGSTVSRTGALKENYDEIIDDIEVWHPMRATLLSGRVDFLFGDSYTSLQNALEGDSILDAGLGHFSHDGNTDFPRVRYEFDQGVLVNGPGPDLIFVALSSTASGFTLHGNGMSMPIGGGTSFGETAVGFWHQSHMWNGSPTTPGQPIPDGAYQLLYSTFDISALGVPEGQSIELLELESPSSGDWFGIGAINHQFDLQIHEGAGPAKSEDDEDDPSKTKLKSRDWLGAQLSIRDFKELEDGAYLTVHAGHEDIVIRPVDDNELIELMGGNETTLLDKDDKLTKTPPRLQIDVAQPGKHYIELRYHKDSSDTEGVVVDSVTFELGDGGYANDDEFQVDYELGGEVWSFDVLENDYKPNELTITGVSGAQQGTTTVSGSSIIYTPSPNAIGWETFRYTVRNSKGETFDAEVVIGIDRPNLIREVELDELDPASKAALLANYRDWLFRTAEQNFGHDVAVHLRDTYPTISRPGTGSSNGAGGINEPVSTLEYIARLIGKGWTFEGVDLPWSSLIFGGQSDLIDFARDVNGRTIKYGVRHNFEGNLVSSAVTEDISARDQANIIYQYVSNPQVVPSIGGVVHYDSPTWTGVKAFFSHPNTQFVLVAGAAAIAGPAGWAAAGALSGTFTVGTLTVTAAGAAQASLVVGSAWAIARAGDEAIGNVVDSDGDGEGDRTFGQSLIDYTTGDQSLTNDIVTSADIAVFIVEVGPGIFNMVRGAVGFAKQVATNTPRVVKSLGQNVSKLVDRDTYCFDPNTLVSTPSGCKPIHSVRRGDIVLAFDFASGSVVESTVHQTHRNPYSGKWYSIRLENGTTVEVTQQHPFWIVNGDELEARSVPALGDSHLPRDPSIVGRWIFSHEVRIGDSMRTVDGDVAIVVAVDVTEVVSQDVCNLTLADNHCYFVSELGLLVHNINWCDEYLKYLTRTGQAVFDDAGKLKKPQALLDIIASNPGWTESYIHAHHIVMKKGKGIFGRIYTNKSQELLRKYHIEVLENEDSIRAAGNNFDNMCFALNYKNDIHSRKYQRYIMKGLQKAEKEALDEGLDAGQAIRNQLADWKTKFENGEVFWNGSI